MGFIRLTAALGRLLSYLNLDYKEFELPLDMGHIVISSGHHNNHSRTNYSCGDKNTIITDVVNLDNKVQEDRISIKDVDEMDGQKFEKFLGILFNDSGYDVEITSASCDYGADLILTKDEIRIAVQAKRWDQKVTLKAVQEIAAAKTYYKCDKSWVVTNNFFTSPAIELAESTNVFLIDRSTLENMLVSNFPEMEQMGAISLSKFVENMTVDSLIGALSDDDFDVRDAAAKALGDIGDLRAVDPLIEALNDEGWEVRADAAWSLGDIGDSRAVGPLIEALNDENSSVRASVAGSLVKLGETDHFGQVIQALKDEDSDARAAAVGALGEIGDARAVDTLIDALNDVVPGVRGKAAEALGKIGDPRAIGFVVAGH